MAKKPIALIGVAIVAGGIVWMFGRSDLPPAPDRGVPAQAQMQDGTPTIGQWGLDLAGMNRSVRPGDDFFRYVNGAWLETAEIPADRRSTGSFLDLAIRTEDRVTAILAELDAKTDPTEIERKVRDLYQSYIDTAHLEELGLAPAEADLETIASLQTHEDVARAMGSARMGTQSIFDAGIGIDDKNSDAYAVFLGQSGLGLPDRDYYLLDETGTVAAREAYRIYIGDMLALGGAEDTEAKADAVFALESAIAEWHWPRADTRDADKIYNPMTVGELVDFAPDFPWPVFLEELGIGAPPVGEREVIVSENTAFPGLAELFSRTPVAVWRDYLIFHYLSSQAAYLPKRFDDARFDFYGRILAGQTEQLDRAKRGIQFINRNIGEGVGELYVAQHFSLLAKAEAQALVANLLDVYRARIQMLDWMSPDTREKALEKVGTFVVKVGYPDEWRDYSNYLVVPGDLYGNATRGRVFDWERDIERLDDPVDRGEWGMSPQTVNAYYSASLNEIVFPAAILQAPFFDPNADDAINYGAIGAVIGHEISHGFDDQGSKYDAYGILENWWTDADRSNFDARTERLVEQYGGYSPIRDMFVNGRLTLGENIADLAGLTIAQAAYRLSLAGGEAAVLDGFTGDQRVFLGFGQVWRYKAREETMRNRILSDPHAPPEFRVNGVVRNIDAWYESFDAAPDAALYLTPGERVQLW